MDENAASPVPEKTVAASVAVLESIIEANEDEEAWRQVGGARANFLGLHLLQLLFAEGQERGAVTDAQAYARSAQARAEEPRPPIWLVEATVRAPTGEPHLVEGLDPEAVQEVAGYLLRDLVAVLELPGDDLARLVRLVAATPMPSVALDGP